MWKVQGYFYSEFSKQVQAIDILNWLKPKIYLAILESQYDWCPQHGCADQLFTLQMLMKKAREISCPLIFVSNPFVLATPMMLWVDQPFQPFFSVTITYTSQDTDYYLYISSAHRLNNSYSIVWEYLCGVFMQSSSLCSGSNLV